MGVDPIIFVLKLWFGHGGLINKSPSPQKQKLLIINKSIEKTEVKRHVPFGRTEKRSSGIGKGIETCDSHALTADHI